MTDTPPVAFTTGDVLPPEDLNRSWLYAKDAVIDAAQKRWAKGMLLFQFVEGVGTPYTNAMTGTEELTYRFTCPTTCFVERGFLNGNFTATVDLQIVIETAAGATPTGCTVPYMQTGVVTSALVDTSDSSNDRFFLVANTEYKVRVVGAGAFVLNRFDVTLHIAVDRWTNGGVLAVPSYQPTLHRDGGIPAATMNANFNALGVGVTDKFATSKANAMTPAVLAVKHGFVTGTSANLLTFTVPKLDSARAKCVLKKLYLYTFTAGVTTITATFTGVAPLTTNAAGFASSASATLSTAIDFATPGISATPGSDFNVILTNSSATNCIKAYVIGWFARA